MSEELRPFPPVLQPGPHFDLLNGLWAYAGEYAELGRHCAHRLSLHSTDANALIEVLWAERTGKPLSPARLAAVVGLTSGATNALINRLEQAGYLTRSREHADRRQVTLRSTELARDRTEELYTRPSSLLEEALNGLEQETIGSMVAALGALTSTMARINQEMAEGP